MSTKSFVYRHVFIYRLIMDVLYLGRYKKRFTSVFQQIIDLPPGSTILELCFGDVYLAGFCKKAGYIWKGLDLNEHFVKKAQQMGFDAHYEDLTRLEILPKADVCIMMGSLYHFHPHTTRMLEKMFKCANCVVISEPVSNLSSSPGLIGFLAKRAANAGKGHEVFRYDTNSFLAMIQDNSVLLQYRIVSIQHHGKDLIVKLIKNEKS